MIVHPENWKEIGQPIYCRKIENTLVEILSDINCNSLAFSGGLDSSIMLYTMLQIHDKVHAFTIGYPANHPDIEHAKLIVSKLDGNISHHIFTPTIDEIVKSRHVKDYQGDNAVRLLYKYISDYTNSVIACDGIDEFTGGYYAHQSNPSEETYYGFLKKLRDEQLIPLDKNSGYLKVYLPYLDSRLILLLAQIPLEEKVDFNQRKKIMVSLAKSKISSTIINRRKYGFCDAILS